MDYPDSIEPATLYWVYIEWDHEDIDIALALCDRIFRLRQHPKLNVDDRGGNACWNYYLCIEGPNKNIVKKHAEKILRLLKRRKATLYQIGV